MTKHPHWAVAVEAGGEEIVRLETECYGGRELSAADEGVVRTAALHLLAFIGDRKAEAWQPIETAPHEALVVLGWYEDASWKQEIALASAGERFSNGYSNRWWHGRATHWMPLPAPPTTTEADHD